ncbi:DEAD H (Asp-Glu-Ala-Asp His) box helicase 11 [Boothiomyces sp. JEL0866]|nr:DEAD H (Asp-Glu-Ala-Asp His) box helicase 11 [Boothiomyces sp. JEL0866]
MAICDLNVILKETELLFGVRKLDLFRSELELSQSRMTKDEFHFPYTPWSIQSDLYSAIDESKIGFFESPTGTGKTLSLICGAFKWLRDYESKPIEELVDMRMLNYVPRLSPKERKKLYDMIADERNKRNEHKQYLQTLRNQPKLDKKIKYEELDVDSGLLIEYETKPKWKILEEELLNQNTDKIQIIYTSRTHSQISQFVQEIKKTVYSDIPVTSLGSRKTLCVNENVRKLTSLTKINDKCTDLQGNNPLINENNSCRYLPKVKENVFENMSDHIHSLIRDIEELRELGKEMCCCPYYGARFAVKNASIVCVPYNLLLSKTARESSGINLKGSIVIIDEAHNIVEAVNSIHSTKIDMAILKLGLNQLNTYFEKYQSRLNGNSILYIKQLQFIINSFINTYSAFQDGGLNSKMIKVNEFVDDCKIDHLNLFKILDFLALSKLPNKLQGFMEKSMQQVDINLNETDISKHTSPLRNIQQFLESLTANDHDGRIILSQNSIKYLLLNPSECFMDIVNEAKSVIFAGGTLSPIKEFINELVPSVEPARIHQFSCDHVIPPDQMMPIVLTSGPTGKELKFTYENRNDPLIINEVGRAIANICNVVKGGVVVFFPSYSYLESVTKEWKSSPIMTNFQKKKQIFFESNSVDDLLALYTRAVKHPDNGKTGAILFAVVGGKLSEGINFSDDLGRAVIMIGLPYPNIKSPELIEKMNYLDSKEGITGAEYFENLCMKAVNQCIGRAIRHKGDYASVILMDTRYSNNNIQNKLPNWIRRSEVLKLNFGECI